MFDPAYARMLLITVMFLTCAERAPAQPAPAPSASAAAAFACPLAVMDAIPLGVKTGEPAATYAIGLQNFDAAAGRVSGTLAVLSGNKRYDVPFHDAVAAGAMWDTIHQIVPIVVQFPEAIKIDAVYLAAVSGPNGGPCQVAGPFVPISEYRYGGGPLDVEKAITSVATMLKPIQAPAPSIEESRSCDRVAEAARVTVPASADTPQLASANGQGGAVYVEVVLTPTGSVATAWVWASPFASLNGAATVAAKVSKFRAAQVRCTPVAGIYMFVIMFAA